MKKCKQTFRNSTAGRLIINLELSTSRYRLKAGEELIHFFDPADDPHNEGSAALNIEFIATTDGLELVIWTKESELFLTSGCPAPQDFNVP
jgi:hypothetical protein